MACCHGRVYTPDTEFSRTTLDISRSFQLHPSRDMDSRCSGGDGGGGARRFSAAGGTDAAAAAAVAAVDAEKGSQSFNGSYGRSTSCTSEEQHAAEDTSAKACL